jgi:hypothetical protein
VTVYLKTLIYRFSCQLTTKINLINMRTLMTCGTHSKKEVEDALAFAESFGWRVKGGGKGHAWGKITVRTTMPSAGAESSVSPVCGVRLRILAITPGYSEG